VKKWTNELNNVFSKEDVQMAKKHMKKMFTIPGHKGNANQNHSKFPPHSCYNGCDQKHHQQQMWQGHRENGTIKHCC
jgi:hypothetical protein